MRSIERLYVTHLSRARQDSKVHLYKYEGGTLKEDGLLEGNRGPVTAISFSPDGSKLVAGDVR